MPAEILKDLTVGEGVEGTGKWNKRADVRKLGTKPTGDRGVT